MSQELTKEDMWEAYRTAVRQASPHIALMPKEVKVTRNKFEDWWEQQYE